MFDGLHRSVRQWTRTIFTVIFYLEATTLENGCMWLVLGSHHFPGLAGKIGESECTQAIAE
jgi:hypothetical protein